jgi:hypothetical protein
MQKVSNNNYWTLWTVRNAFAVALSIIVAAAIVVTYQYFAGKPDGFKEGFFNLMIMLLAAICQGITYGWMQWTVLKVKFTEIKLSEWLWNTTVALVFCWSFAIIPVLLKIQFFNPKQYTEENYNLKLDSFWLSTSIVNPEQTTGGSFNYAVFGAIMTGLFFGGILGFFQWLVLKRHAENAYYWIIANSIAWGAGAFILFLTDYFIQITTPVPLKVGFESAGLIMASLLISSITGLIMVWIKILDTRNEMENY